MKRPSRPGQAERLDSIYVFGISKCRIGHLLGSLRGYPSRAVPEQPSNTESSYRMPGTARRRFTPNGSGSWPSHRPRRPCPGSRPERAPRIAVCWRGSRPNGTTGAPGGSATEPVEEVQTPWSVGVWVGDQVPPIAGSEARHNDAKLVRQGIERPANIQRYRASTRPAPVRETNTHNIRCGSHPCCVLLRAEYVPLSGGGASPADSSSGRAFGARVGT